MSDTAPTRVNFFEHQFLRADDFTAEQAYQLQGLRRHNIAGHHWGIVHGLEVIASEEGDIKVLEGVAVDGYGRMLIHQVYYAISTNAFDDQGSDVLEIWLLYDRRAGEAVPNGYADCDNERQVYREVETARVEVRAPDPNQIGIGGTQRPDGRHPLEVNPDDLDFEPQRTPPDDPDRFWPVYLGQVRRDSSGEVQVDMEGRPHAGLVGEFIRSPSGGAFLQVGAEWPGDANRFALYLDIGNGPLPAPGTQPDLAIDAQGEISIYHDTTLYGDLTIDGGAMVLNRGPLYDAQQPWRIYHTEAPSEAQAGITVEQLRIEMAPAGTSGEVVIGHWSAQANKFVPCLTVDNSCTVTVHGDLEIQGNMTVTGTIINLMQTVQALTAMMSQEVQAAPGTPMPAVNALVNTVKLDPELHEALLKMLLVNEIIDAPAPAASATGEVLYSAGQTDTVAVEKPVEEPLAPDVAESADDRRLDVQDNLIEIKGIGPVFAERLTDAGIQTFAALAAMGDEELDAIVQPSRYQKPDYAAWRNEAAARSTAATGESTDTISAEEESSSAENEA